MSDILINDRGQNSPHVDLYLLLDTDAARNLSTPLQTEATKTLQEMGKESASHVLRIVVSYCENKDDYIIMRFHTCCDKEVPSKVFYLKKTQLKGIVLVPA